MNEYQPIIEKLESETLDIYLKQCMKIVQEDGMALQFIKDQTVDICSEAVKQNCMALRFVDTELLKEIYVDMYIDIYYDICTLAVTNSWKAMLYVRQSVLPTDKYLQLCMIGVQQDADTLCLIDEDIITKEIYMEAVKQCGTIIDIIKPEMITMELCMEAVKQNSYVLKLLPKHIKNDKDMYKQLYEIAKIHDLDAHYYIDQNLDNSTFMKITKFDDNGQTMLYIKTDLSPINYIKRKYGKEVAFVDDFKNINDLDLNKYYLVIEKNPIHETYLYVFTVETRQKVIPGWLGTSYGSSTVEERHPKMIYEYEIMEFITDNIVE